LTDAGKGYVLSLVKHLQPSGHFTYHHS